MTQESTQQQLQTGTPSADMEFNNFPPPSQLPQLIAAKDPLLQHRADVVVATRTSSSTSVSPNNKGRWRT